VCLFNRSGYSGYRNRWRRLCNDSRWTGRDDVYVRTAVPTGPELNDAINKGKQRIVFTQTYVFAGVMLRTPLTDNDIAGNSRLAAEQLYAQALAV